MSKNYKHHFCDRKCESDYIKAQAIKNIACDNCGVFFHRKTSHLSNKNFCSRNCKNKYILTNGVSEATKRKMSESAVRKLKEHPELLEKIRISNIGRIRSRESIEKQRVKVTGQKRTLEQIERMKKNMKRGADSNFWKGGISSLKHLVDDCDISKRWKRSILERDNFTCQVCGQYGETLEIHHKIPFADILHKIVDENPTKTKDELFEICKKDPVLWDINNGVTLCHNCHKKTDSYGNNGFNKKWLV